jgi:hypothetical protein
MTIGNEGASLSDVIIEALKEIGHEYEDYGSERNLGYGPEKLKFKVTGYSYVHYNYHIEVDRTKNTAKLSVGTFPEFDFHKPDSITLFKAAMMQVPTLLVLRDVGDMISNLVIPKDRY